MRVTRLADVPRKIRELYERGVAAMERGNLDYAIDTFIDLLDREPGVLEVRKVLRAAEIRRFKDAKGGTVNHVISSIVGLPGVISAKLTLKKNPEKAIQTAEKLLKIDPLNLMFLYLLAEAGLSAEIPEISIMALETARDHRPDDITLLRRLGAIYIAHDRHHDARLLYERLMKMKPNDQEIIKAYKDATALDSMSKGGWTEAGSFRDIIRDSGEAARLEQEGKAVKTAKDIDQLIADSEEKQRREPDNVNYARALADLYTRAERFDEALLVLAGIQERASMADPQIDRAISEIRLQKFDYEIAQLAASGDADGAAEKRAERDIFRLDDAKERVKRYPNDLLFRYELGVLVYEQGEYNEAIQQFQMAQRNPQRRVRALYYLGLCFKAKQQYDIALEQFLAANEELAVMDETKKDIIYEIAQLYEAMDQREEAKQHFRQIYSVDISYKDVAEKIEKTYAT